MISTHLKYLFYKEFSFVYLGMGTVVSVCKSGLPETTKVTGTRVAYKNNGYDTDHKSLDQLKTILEYDFDMIRISLPYVVKQVQLMDNSYIS